MPNPADRPALAAQHTSSPDPADYGTAFGLEMSFDAPKSGAPLETNTETPADADADPMAWIRRWVEQHKPA